MYEKVNPSHPDKIADRIAGAIVDLAYSKCMNPKIAVEVLIGHGKCLIIVESSAMRIEIEDITLITDRIVGKGIDIQFVHVPQDVKLAENQEGLVRCGDNGVFKGCPITFEQEELSCIARDIYDLYGSDGKYLINGETLTVCQSNMPEGACNDYCYNYDVIENPLGYWEGGTDVDCGATNRKLGSDLGNAVTGGGIHGKDLSKADVSVNIWLHKLAQETGEEQVASCSIGDKYVNGVPFSEIVDEAKKYIDEMFDGSFEKMAEWGLI